MEEQGTEQTLQEDQQPGQQKEVKDRRLPLFFGGMAAGIAICVLIGAGFFAGKSIYGLVKTQGGAQSESSVVNTETIQKMKTLESVIDKYYYDYKDEPATEESLQTGIYKGMTEALNDPYSEYYTAEELKEVVNDNNGVSYALVHRDLLRSAPIRIFIFDNRVEIISPGALAGGLTIDDIRNGARFIKKGVLSRKRNYRLFWLNLQLNRESN